MAAPAVSRTALDMEFGCKAWVIATSAAHGLPLCSEEIKTSAGLSFAFATRPWFPDGGSSLPSGRLCEFYF